MISGGTRGAGHVTRSVSRTELGDHRVLAPRLDEDSQIVVGCGRATVGEHIAIVDPRPIARACRAGRVGEVWVGGPQRRARLLAQRWRRRVGHVQGADRGRAGRTWLRTGDLGFLDESGELFVTGRIKDLIIIRGSNHYPQDIERTVQDSHPALRAGLRRRVLGAGRRRRGKRWWWCRRSSGRTATPSMPPRSSAESARRSPSEHEIARATIVLIRPGDLAEDHQRQDPAQRRAAVLARTAARASGGRRRLSAREQ